MNMPSHGSPTIQYIAFDKKTGRIFHTYSRFDVVKNQSVEVPIDELKETLVKDASLFAGLTDQDPANLDILKVGPNDAVPALENAMMVDVAHRKIIQKPTLVLTADKREIVGDGRDSATIEVRAVNSEGKLLDTVEDRIKITVTRGKLSSRGGIVDLVEGRATITLTSVNETVDNVRVGAVSLTGACGSGYLALEFV